MEPVSESRGNKMKTMIHAQKYLECSAQKEYNMKEVFDEAVKVVLHPPSAVMETESTAQPRTCCEVA
jgi:Ras-related C3 botulinum toxin substrate 1